LVDLVVRLHPSYRTGGATGRDILVITKPDRLAQTQVNERVVLEICGPRSNKTSALVVPAVLCAPGPVITTSNKVDAYTLTVHGRRQIGRVFVLDPQGIARVEYDWWWNPLRAVTDMASAAQLATHFIATVGGGSDRADPYFTPASARLLAQHLPCRRPGPRPGTVALRRRTPSPCPNVGRRTPQQPWKP
jgi:hypothetical protein